MILIAHRSGPTIYPEQTVKSALLALKDGADMAELDVRFTKDKRLAVCHDDTAERVFGVDTRIDEMTAEEFTALTHKDAPDFHAHLFEEYVEAGVFPMLIHVKEVEVIPTLLETLKKYNRLFDVTIGVNKPEAVTEIKNYNSGIKVLAFMKNPDVFEDYVKVGADYYRLWEDWLERDGYTFDFIQHKIWIMTRFLDTGYTTPERLIALQKLGIHGILVNDIPTTIEVLKK